MRSVLAALVLLLLLPLPVSHAEPINLTFDGEVPARPSDTVSLSRDDYLKLRVGSYIFGFNDFDLSLTVLHQRISVGIYYDGNALLGEKVLALQKRFERQIPLMLQDIPWIGGYSLLVSVYRESATASER